MAARTADGPLLAGRYRVIERLGVGGMAAVYLAQDERLGRRVAVKRLHTSGDDDMDARRFEREGKIGASLSHPNLVSIFDTWQDEESVLLVMEYVDGETLGDAIARGPLQPDRVVCIVRAVANALDHAHKNGIVHRDIKPGNVLLGKDGSVKLADLGIAKALERTDITGTGTVLGTPAYMAPEQLEGGDLGPSVDVYALAAMAFEMLTGTKARQGRTAVEIAHRSVNEPPPDPRDHDPGVPAAAAHAIRSGMAKDPSERPSTAAAMAAELEESFREVAVRSEVTEATEVAEATVEQPVQSAQPALRGTPRPARGRRGGWLLPAGGLAALALAALAIALTAGDGDEQKSGQASNPPAAGKPEKKEPTKQQPTKQQPAEQPVAAAPAEGMPQPQGKGGDAKGRELHLEGFRLLNQGDYAASVEVSRRAIEAFELGTQDLNYAFALFTLGKALRLGGKPAEAIPVLEARLQIPNQTETVRKELELARSAAG